MPAKVVDSSVVAAIVFAEPEADRAVEMIGDDELLAPHLLRYELTNVAWKKTRKRPKDAARVEAGLRLALDLDVRYLDVDYPAVLDLATAAGITAYDAAYLWLARTLKAPLATFDARLIAASGKRR